MKKHLKSFAIVAFLLSPLMMYAAYASKFKLANFKQVDETSFTFDLELHNTGDEAFGLDAAQCKIVYNQGIYGAQSANIAQVRAITPLSTSLVGWYGGDGNVAPTLLSQIMTVTGNPGYIVFVTNALPNVDGSEIDLFAPGTYKKLATIKVLFTTGSNPNIKNRPFEEVLHSLAFDATLINHTVNRVNTYDAISTPGKVYKIGLIPAFSPLPQPSIENLPSSTANRLLAKYCFTGTGDFSEVARWNNATTSDITGYHIAPSASSNVNIAGVCTITSNNTVNDLTINTGAHLTLNSGFTVSATKLYINSDAANGTGTFVDLNNAGGLSVSGTTEVHQYITNGRNWYVSSPVSLASSNVFAASVLKPLHYYGEAISDWYHITDMSTSLSVMSGYVANIATSGNVIFTGGDLNTGPLNTSLSNSGATKTGYNLIGNPYPSFLNWESVLSSANTANLSTTMWYRTKNGSNNYVFDTYNATDHFGTNNNGTAVTQFIPPMQAVWVKVATGVGTIGFDNSMRSHQNQSITSNRLKAPGAVKSSQRILRLQVSNGVNSDETIILYNNNASDEFDTYDSPKMSNNNYKIPEIYTKAGNEKLVINGLSEFDLYDEIPLGFFTGESNAFTIKATDINNFNSDITIILKDKLMDAEQELTTTNNYSFNSDTTNTLDRFSIEFRSSKAPTAIVTNKNDQSIRIYKNANNQISVSFDGESGLSGNVVVYNAAGQMLVNKPTTEKITVIEKPLNAGVYVVTAIIAGNSNTKKVVIN